MKCPPPKKDNQSIDTSLSYFRVQSRPHDEKLQSHCKSSVHVHCTLYNCTLNTSMTEHFMKLDCHWIVVFFFNWDQSNMFCRQRTDLALTDILMVHINDPQENRGKSLLLFFSALKLFPLESIFVRGYCCYCSHLSFLQLVHVFAYNQPR